MISAAFHGEFDPFNVQSLAQAKQLIKENNIRTLYVVIDENEKLGESEVRFRCARQMCEPFRKMKVVHENDRILRKVMPVFHEDSLSKTFSGQIREGHFEKLNKSARRTIIESGIYCHSIVKSMVKPSRYAHSVSVAKLCSEIAKAHDLDSYKAYLIGMYHDIAKSMSKQQMEFLMELHQPYELNYDYHVWHQYVGMMMLKNYFRMKDRVILNAVRHHCLGDDSNTYSIIVYLADKLDPSRGYDSSKEIELARHDLLRAYDVVRKQQKEYLQKENVI